MVSSHAVVPRKRRSGSTISIRSAQWGASVIILGLIKLLLGLFASNIVVFWCEMFLKSGAAVLGLLVFLARLELFKMGNSLNSRSVQVLRDENTGIDQAGTRDLLEGQGVLTLDGPMVRTVSIEEGMRRWTIMMVRLVLC